METKKSNRANLEKKRSVFFQAGLLLALGFTFLAFEWQVSPRISDITWDPVPVVPEPDFVMPQTHTQALPPPPNPSVDFEIVANEILVDTDFFFDPEITETMPISTSTFTTQKIVEVDEPDVFDIVESPPSCAGFREYIRNNLKYPQIAAENGISGKVYVQFIVDQNGNVTNAEILRGIDPLLDSEALRLINNSPKWIPGKQREKAVKVRFTFPIVFKLQ